MGGEDYEHYKEARRERALDGEDNREKATREFAEACKMATPLGLCLIQKSPQHYQIMPTNRRWLLNLYPGNQRVYTDPNKPERGPYLGLRIPWGLVDVIEFFAREARR